MNLESFAAHFKGIEQGAAKRMSKLSSFVNKPRYLTKTMLKHEANMQHAAARIVIENLQNYSLQLRI